LLIVYNLFCLLWMMILIIPAGQLNYVEMNTDADNCFSVVISDEECAYVREAVNFSEGKSARNLSRCSQKNKAAEKRVAIARKQIGKWRTTKQMKRVEALHLLRKCRPLLIKCGLLEVAEQARDCLQAYDSNVVINSSRLPTSSPSIISAAPALCTQHPVSAVSESDQETIAMDICPAGSSEPVSCLSSLLVNDTGHSEAVAVAEEWSPEETEEFPNIASFQHTLPDDAQDDFEVTFPYLAEGLIAASQIQRRKLDFCQVLRHWATQTHPNDTDLTCLLQCLKIAGVTEIKPETLPNKGSQLMAVSYYI
jgi:hypothetical protein